MKKNKIIEVKKMLLLLILISSGAIAQSGTTTMTIFPHIDQLEITTGDLAGRYYGDTDFNNLLKSSWNFVRRGYSSKSINNFFLGGNVFWTNYGQGRDAYSVGDKMIRTNGTVITLTRSYGGASWEWDGFYYISNGSVMRGLNTGEAETYWVTGTKQ